MGLFILRVSPRQAHAKHVAYTERGHSRAGTKLCPLSVYGHVPSAHVSAEGRDIDESEAFGEGVLSPDHNSAHVSAEGRDIDESEAFGERVARSLAEICLLSEIMV